MLRLLDTRSLGVVDPVEFCRAETTRRVFNLGLSENKEFERLFTGNINTLDIDLVERRYLLSGGADGYIVIYDTYNRPGHTKYKCQSVGTIALNNKHRHKYSVETVLWYPLDTGMFTSSGSDHTLKIWDTNTLKPADEYEFTGIVFNHHMSPIATKHCLLAVASCSPTVKLVDLKSGSATHSLKGHNKAVLAVKWSPFEEFMLASGSSDCKIFLWDIRNAKGSLFEFDQFNGKLPKDCTSKDSYQSHNGPVNGLQFSSDGLYVISCGTDNTLHLWSTATGEKIKTDFGNVPNVGKRTVQFTVSEGCTPDLVFMPCGNCISAIDIWTGQKQFSLQGHFMQVNACCYNRDVHELYSTGADRSILVWQPNTRTGCQRRAVAMSNTNTSDNKPEKQKQAAAMVTSATADSWSSDEDN